MTKQEALDALNEDLEKLYGRLFRAEDRWKEAAQEVVCAKGDIRITQGEIEDKESMLKALME